MLDQIPAKSMIIEAGKNIAERTKKAELHRIGTTKNYLFKIEFTFAASDVNDLNYPIPAPPGDYIAFKNDQGTIGKGGPTCFFSESGTQLLVSYGEVVDGIKVRSFGGLGLNKIRESLNELSSTEKWQIFSELKTILEQ